MTVQEFDNEFDILYDNVMSNSAPALDTYEKSTFLTRAQTQFVKNMYLQYEQSEYFRNALRPLMTGKTVVTTLVGVHIVPESVFFDTPDDLMFIVFEQVDLVSDDTCLNEKTVNVIPVKHDEFNMAYQNPFRKPNKDIVWRMDYGTVGVDKATELIPDANASISKYKVRYIKYPTPIILGDITPETIHSTSAQTEAIVPPEFHDEILNIAVQLAKEQYINKQ